MKKLWKIYTAVILFFMYMPIIVLLIFSFNNGKTTVWKGFTLRWYSDLFNDRMIMNALWNTLIIAILASIIATVLGTMAAIGINNLTGKFHTGVSVFGDRWSEAAEYIAAHIDECTDADGERDLYDRAETLYDVIIISDRDDEY